MKEYIIKFDTDEPLSEIASGTTIRAVMKTVGDCDEIIRCKDCKFSKAYYHGSESNLGMFTYLCTQGLYGMNADDYCSRAERKDR